MFQAYSVVTPHPEGRGYFLMLTYFFLSKLYDGLTYFFFQRMYGMPGWPHGRIVEELLGVSFPWVTGEPRLAVCSAGPLPVALSIQP